MRIVVTGIIGQYPVAGVTCCYLQWVLGFQKLGHEVYYIEDNGTCPYNPETQNVDVDYSYSLPYMRKVMSDFGLQDQWAYMTCDGEYFGMGRQQVLELYRSAELLVNLSGATVLRDEHMACRLRAFVDTDPGFQQFAAADGDQDTISFIAAHNIQFTYAENIGKPGCKVPEDHFDWKMCRQPAFLDMWQPVYTPRARLFTTVTNWSAYAPAVFRGETYGQKDIELKRFIGLPSHTIQPIELSIAVTGEPAQLLRSHGWRVRDPRPPTKDIETWRKYISKSRAEYSVAKNAYVKTWSGWFSERDANYLACGKPVLAQDTGFSEWLSARMGIVPFSTLEEAVEGIDRINSDYRAHCTAARKVAEEYLDSNTVLTEFLAKCGA